MKKILFTLLLIFTFNYSFADSYPEIIGEASYYSNRLHGRKTSSGELYNMHKFTCAHKTYPFGTVLKVTNLKNNAFIHVTVNDRGPYAKSRIVDLSMAAAKELNMVQSGVARVKVEIMSMPERKTKKKTRIG